MAALRGAADPKARAQLRLGWLIATIATKVTAARLVPLRTYLRVLPLVLAAISPLVACALAATYVRLTRRTS